MTTAFAEVPLARSDSATIPMTRLVEVESRKLVNTRAGFWLIAGMAAASIGAGALFAGFGASLPADWAGASQLVLYPMMLLLPVLAALTMTSEWSTRSGLVTFTLEPRRGRVLAAKAFVLVGAAAVALLFALLVGAATVLAQGTMHDVAIIWALPTTGLLGMFAMMLAATFFGAGLGALTHNAPASIVALFLTPTLFAAAGAVSETAASVLTWVDYNQTLTFLFQGWGGGLDWARAAVSVLVMIGLPTAVGVWRTMRREVS